MHARLILIAISVLLVDARFAFAEYPVDYVAGELVTLNDNGAWSWFMDERAIVQDGKLLVGSVRAVKDFGSGQADPNWGNVELAVHDFESGKTDRVVLHPHFEQDDHDNPALLALPDGRVLAIYTRHAVERKVFYRRSTPHNTLEWGPIQEIETPGEDAHAFSGSNTTYSNVFQLKSGRLINFYRGFNYDPNHMTSDDGGETWKLGGRLLAGRNGYGPYMKYVSDGDETIHFVATEDHPRKYDNSLYHAYLRDGQIYASDSSPLAPLSDTTETKLTAWDLTKVFAGGPDDVAWMIDLELDAERRPCVIFSVQKDGRDLPRKQGGFDHRFHYARWDDKRWWSHEIAYAGSRLYPGEDDYTGLAAIDPRDTNVIYISTNADPMSGEPLLSEADGKRHHELFRGETADGGATWKWTPITANSTIDNLRPIVPKWDNPRTALVWMRGRYRNNHGEWTTAVVATVLPK